MAAPWWSARQVSAAAAPAKKLTWQQKVPRRSACMLALSGVTKDMTTLSGRTCATPVGVTVRRISACVTGQVEATSMAPSSSAGRNRQSKAHQA